MKLFIFSKNEKIATINIIIIVILSVVISNTAMYTAMLTHSYPPITSVLSEKKELAITVNIASLDDIRFFSSVKTSIPITFFIDTDIISCYPHEAKLLTDCGHNFGLLINGDGVNDNNINDFLAEQIEAASRITGKNPSLIRFSENRYSNSSVKSVCNLGLYPVQWSTDSSLGTFSKGDIILINNVGELNSLLKKIKADGYQIVSVSDLINYKAYSIDLSGQLIPH